MASRFIPDFSAAGTAGLPTFVYRVKRTLQDALGMTISLKESRTVKDAFVASILTADKQIRRLSFFVPSARITASETRKSVESIILALATGEKSTRGDVGIITLQILNPGPFSFTAPPGVYSPSCALWAAGGGGAGNLVTYGGGGGGGGAYSKKNSIAVTPGQVISGNVGASGGSGAAGGDTWFSSQSTALAKGGAGGAVGTLTAGGAGGAGGASASGVGDVLYSGGVGSGGGALFGGGGGGGAGSTGAGTASPNQNGGAGTVQYGGNGADGAGATASATTPGNYGGGGGGATSTVAQLSAGAQGFATITYTV